ncbi:MAG: 2Fe-2S iron-sulfur cluster-binding protein [Flavobacteriaceae bacterium]|nr:2Fe-2S iron-sulfur cluster-binding protein [Flavobacteriaceae bacterium]
MSAFHAISVTNIVKNTAEAVTISFRIPNALKEQFRFKAGQYITIKKTLNDCEIRRAYSICTSPSEEVFSIGVKAISGGIFSTYANTQLQEGDVLELMPPEGRFLYDTSSDIQCLGLIAAGSGITPVLSIAKAALENDAIQKVVLLYGNKTPDQMMFASELAQLQQLYPERFVLKHSYSQAQESAAYRGRIDAGTIQETFGSYTLDAFYLCGPEQMIEEAKTSLEQSGQEPSSIHFELFTVSSDGNSDTVAAVADGETQITILLDDEESTFTAKSDKFLLDAALEEDLDAPYSCQGGVCSSCLAKVTHGKARMLKNQILTDKEVEEGFILTCQALSETSEIHIDFDDV